MPSRIARRCSAAYLPAFDVCYVLPALVTAFGEHYPTAGLLKDASGLLKDARSLLLQPDTKLRSDRDAKLRIVDTFIATLCLSLIHI